MVVAAVAPFDLLHKFAKRVEQLLSLLIHAFRSFLLANDRPLCRRRQPVQFPHALLRLTAPRLVEAATAVSTSRARAAGSA